MSGLFVVFFVVIWVAVFIFGATIGKLDNVGEMIFVPTLLGATFDLLLFLSYLIMLGIKHL